MQQQIQQDMDSVIANELEEGERVLWTGRPHPTSRANNPQTRVFAIIAIIYGIVGLVMLFIGIIVSATVEGPGGKGTLLGLAIPGSIFVILAIVFGIVAAVYRPGLKSTVYAITEQRIIIVATSRVQITYSYSKGDIGPLTRIEQKDGTGDLIFSTNRQGAPYGMYGYNAYYNSSTSGTTTTSNMAVGRAAANAGRFLGVPNVREVERIVRHTFA